MTKHEEIRKLAADTIAENAPLTFRADVVLALLDEIRALEGTLERTRDELAAECRAHAAHHGRENAAFAQAQILRAGLEGIARIAPHSHYRFECDRILALTDKGAARE